MGQKTAQQHTAPTKEKGAITKADPFDNPPSDLHIAQIPPSQPSHNLILNKFPVIPNHFILATKDFRPQTDLLSSGDLEATFTCLVSWERSHKQGTQGRLLAFFNSGEHSGASQPHRHIQFLPIEDVVHDGAGPVWEPLIDELLKTYSRDLEEPVMLDLPFVCFAARIPSNSSANDLRRIYLDLFARSVRAYDEFAGTGFADSRPIDPDSEGPSMISYNMAMTSAAMVVCPRRSDHAWIPLDNDESKAGIPTEGQIQLNGTLLAGTLMVKAESEWMALRREPALLHHILTTVAIPREPVKPL